MSHASPAAPQQTATKARVAAASAAVVSFVLIWVADVEPFTAKEAASAAVSALIAAGVVGSPTYLVPNRRK